MSITYELTEDEFEAIRDAKLMVGLVDAIAANAAERIDISRGELCAFTNVVLGKLQAVLCAAEERREAGRVLADVEGAGSAGSTRTGGRRGAQSTRGQAPI